MSTQHLKLDMLARKDSTEEQKTYYFTRPNLPCLVDLSKVVLFVHPYTNEDGTTGAHLLIKNYHAPSDSPQKKRSGFNSRG